MKFTRIWAHEGPTACSVCCTIGRCVSGVSSFDGLDPICFSCWKARFGRELYNAIVAAAHAPVGDRVAMRAVAMLTTRQQHAIALDAIRYRWYSDPNDARADGYKTLEAAVRSGVAPVILAVRIVGDGPLKTFMMKVIRRRDENQARPQKAGDARDGHR